MSDISILVTNDDGIYAPGIKALKSALEELGTVTVAAPLAEKSAVGHAITLSDPLRVQEVERDGVFFGYAVNGTPADCVKLGIRCLCEKEPDLVVSGINLGPNTAVNIIYSGTVSAAAEGTIMGIPSIAVSIGSFHNHEYKYAAEVTVQTAKKVLKNGLPAGTLLNINVPALPKDEIKGIRITKQGRGRYEENYDKRVDPNQRVYYWLKGKKMILDSGTDVDDSALMDNYVSITPVRYDLTDQKFLKELERWNLTH